jgi:hypothetical protein
VEIAEVINFNLKGGWGKDEAGIGLRQEVMKYVWNKYKLMIELNIDAGETAPEGIPFLGRSDDMEKATKIK